MRVEISFSSYCFPRIYPQTPPPPPFFFFFIYRTQNRLSWGERNLWHVPCIFPAWLFPPLAAGIVCHCCVVVEKRVTSAEYLKRFSYLQTFPEQSHISSPSTVIWRRTVICSDWLPLRTKDGGKRRLCETEKEGKQKAGQGGCVCWRPGSLFTTS